MDAANSNPGELFEIGDDRSERVTVIRVAVQGLGMQHELPAFGLGGGRGNRHLAAELVGRARLAFADALHLGRVHRIDLRPALALLLKTDPQRQIEQRRSGVPRPTQPASESSMFWA